MFNDLVDSEDESSGMSVLEPAHGRVDESNTVNISEDDDGDYGRSVPDSDAGQQRREPGSLPRQSQEHIRDSGGPQTALMRRSQTPSQREPPALNRSAGIAPEPAIPSRWVPNITSAAPVPSYRHLYSPVSYIYRDQTAKKKAGQFERLRQVEKELQPYLEEKPRQ
ncbi:hypothetical protein VTN77DRAFT_6993 [Rasamsonia byssochlamydoides]|uniref:uncharacterized protein n=1 Tax=Rasamsonia byssochlamydoides TaxID=89139 RepID=UPI0037449910